MDFQLVIVRGRGVSSTIKLNDGVTTVGRNDECQLRIKSSQVSRKHCEIFEKKGLLLVKDLGSSNGTYVNGKKIDGQRVLEAGDELMVGQVTFKVSKGTAEAAAAPAARGPKPGDTAVVPVAKPAASATSDTDDFDIDFDDDFETSAPPAQPAETKATEPPTEVVGAAKGKAEAKPQVDNSADDAIADFLLDIKFDDE